jgi:hypothetical protein
MMQDVALDLLASGEPCLRYKVLVNVLGQDPYCLETMQLRMEIARSPRATALLSQRDCDGRIPGRPYRKWLGAHWVLADLADMGYPPGDESLLPLREQVYEWLFGPAHQEKMLEIGGRMRRCASQEGNALYYLLALGLADDRTEDLAQRLVEWQWPDGGWNCDRRPEVANSSFMETLIPMRGLSLHAHMTSAGETTKAAARAARVFLKRNLYKRQSDGAVMDDSFTTLHYPCYWHYDILFGLKVMAEAGYIGHERCQEALDLLESKRLPDGGWPAEQKYYSGRSSGSGRSLVDWGGVSKKHMNPFVTADALYVLKQAGRLR